MRNANLLQGLKLALTLLGTLAFCDALHYSLEQWRASATGTAPSAAGAVVAPDELPLPGRPDALKLGGRLVLMPQRPRRASLDANDRDRQRRALWSWYWCVPPVAGLLAGVWVMWLHAP